jgi:trans-aconitate methyltransferase
LKFGGKRLIRRVKNIFGPQVNLEKFWLKRGKTYFYGEKNRYPLLEIPEYLKDISFNSVLEFGCGAGKVTKFILDNFKVDDYVAFDMSPDQLNHAREQCQKYKVDFQLSQIQKFTTNKKFDLVIGTGVLCHIHPNDIVAVIQQLLSYTKKHFIHVDSEPFLPIWNNYNPKYTRAIHTYRHDWNQIYRDINLNSNISLNVHPLLAFTDRTKQMLSIFDVTVEHSNN